MTAEAILTPANVGILVMVAAMLMMLAVLARYGRL